MGGHCILKNQFKIGKTTEMARSAVTLLGMTGLGTTDLVVLRCQFSSDFSDFSD